MPRESPVLEPSGDDLVHRCPVCDSIADHLHPSTETVEPPARRPSRRALAAFVAAAVVACAAIVGIVFAASSTGDSTTSTKRNRPPVSASKQLAPASAAAVAWAGRELPHDASILADSSLRSALTAAGFTKIVTGSAGAVYVIGDPHSTLVEQVGSSASIASFGSGTGQTVVAQVITDPPADLASVRSADAQARASAETELLANPGVQATGTAADALRSGEVDLRAATVLAFLANSSHIAVLAATGDAPEQAVGLPIRDIQVRSDDLAATQMIIATLPLSYRPSSATQLPSGALELVWPIAAVPPAGIN